MNRLTKLINNSYHLILIMIPIGWWLNTYYYLLRYESEGFHDVIKWILAVGLVFFASCCFIGSQFFLKKQNYTWFVVSLIIYIILAIYSINCTTAGQYWEQQKKNQATETILNEKENQEYMLSVYKKGIKRAEKEYDELAEIKSNSTDDLGDRWYYRNTTKSVEARQTELQTIIEENQIKIESILSENKISAKQETIKKSEQLYKFYSEFLKNISAKQVQFIFQLLLSILIELIAQVSIYLFIQMNDKQIKRDIGFTADEIKKFTKVVYTNIIEKEEKYFLDKNDVIKLMSNGFDQKKYKKLIKVAKKDKLIKAEKGKLKPDSDFIDRQTFYENMCKILKISLT